MTSPSFQYSTLARSPLWGRTTESVRGLTQKSRSSSCASNKRLVEEGVPAARKSLHMVGKAADIRIASLNEEVLGGLIRSFRQGGVGYYYRSGPKGGWIHADTGLNRTWKG